MNKYIVAAHIRAEVTVAADRIADVLHHINTIPVRHWDDPDGDWPPIEPDAIYLDCPTCNRSIDVFEVGHCERCGTCLNDCEGGHLA